jgi:hypothetical protein
VSKAPCRCDVRTAPADSVSTDIALVAALSAMLVAVANLFLVWQTRRLADKTAQLAEADARRIELEHAPYLLLVSRKEMGGVFSTEIHNVGVGPALSVVRWSSQGDKVGWLTDDPGRAMLAGQMWQIGVGASEIGPSTYPYLRCRDQFGVQYRFDTATLTYETVPNGEPTPPSWDGNSLVTL